VRILTADIEGIQDDQKAFGFMVDRIPSGRREAFRADLRAMGGYVLAGFWAARKVIKTWQPDLIHVHFAVPAGPMAWLLSKIYGIPYVLTAHLGDVPGGAPEKTGGWFRWIFPLTPPIWKGASRVVAVSGYTRELALAHYDVEIDVIPNGVDTERIKPATLVQNEVPRIVFAGRFMEQKNPLQLVRVLTRLQHLPWQCVMLGDGPLRTDVEAAIAQQNLGNRISLRGWVDPDVVLAEFAQSDILFMPSRSEGLPVVGVQALASGLAIVAGKVGGFIDLVDQDLNGYLIDPDDEALFVENLAKLLTSAEKLRACKATSIQKAEQFDLKNIVAQYENLFCQIVEGS
jgi:glycosyltransferase involved in cell wall biosynthesis